MPVEKCYSAQRNFLYIFYKDMSGRLRSEYLWFIRSIAHTHVDLKLEDTFNFGAVIDNFLNMQRRGKEECELLKWIINTKLSTS